MQYTIFGLVLLCLTGCGGVVSDPKTYEHSVTVVNDSAHEVNVVVKIEEGWDSEDCRGEDMQRRVVAPKTQATVTSRSSCEQEPSRNSITLTVLGISGNVSKSGQTVTCTDQDCRTGSGTFVLQLPKAQ